MFDRPLGAKTCPPEDSQLVLKAQEIATRTTQAAKLPAEEPTVATLVPLDMVETLVEVAIMGRTRTSSVVLRLPEETDVDGMRWFGN
jgi:hypothetical protein